MQHWWVIVLHLEIVIFIRNTVLNINTLSVNLYSFRVGAKFTCANRDGVLGRRGCTFCNVASCNVASLSELFASKYPVT